MKQFVKALNKDGKCFKYICEKFVHLSDGKLKERIFVGPQIRQLMRDEEFDQPMTPVEKTLGSNLKMSLTVFWEI